MDQFKGPSTKCAGIVDDFDSISELRVAWFGLRVTDYALRVSGKKGIEQRAWRIEYIEEFCPLSSDIKLRVSGCRLHFIIPHSEFPIPNSSFRIFSRGIIPPWGGKILILGPLTFILFLFLF